MIRRPPRSTRPFSSAASDVYKRQERERERDWGERERERQGERERETGGEREREREGGRERERDRGRERERDRGERERERERERESLFICEKFPSEKRELVHMREVPVGNVTDCSELGIDTQQEDIILINTIY